MLKRIGWSFLYFIVYMVVAAIINKLMGNSEWIQSALIGAIGGFFGMFTGYGIGKGD